MHLLGRFAGLEFFMITFAQVARSVLFPVGILIVIVSLAGLWFLGGGRERFRRWLLGLRYREAMHCCPRCGGGRGRANCACEGFCGLDRCERIPEPWLPRPRGIPALAAPRALEAAARTPGSAFLSGTGSMSSPARYAALAPEVLDRVAAPAEGFLADTAPAAKVVPLRRRHRKPGDLPRPGREVTAGVAASEDRAGPGQPDTVQEALDWIEGQFGLSGNTAWFEEQMADLATW